MITLLNWYQASPHLDFEAIALSEYAMDDRLATTLWRTVLPTPTFLLIVSESVM